MSEFKQIKQQDGLAALRANQAVLAGRLTEIESALSDLMAAAKDNTTSLRRLLDTSRMLKSRIEALEARPYVVPGSKEVTLEAEIVQCGGCDACKPEPVPEDDTAEGMLHDAWSVIANAPVRGWGYSGFADKQEQEWIDAAKRWRDAWHKTLNPETDWRCTDCHQSMGENHVCPNAKVADPEPVPEDHCCADHECFMVRDYPLRGHCDCMGQRGPSPFVPDPCKKHNPVVPEWRRLVDEERPTHSDLGIDSLSAVLSMLSVLADPPNTNGIAAIMLARIVAVAEGQVGDGWQSVYTRVSPERVIP